MNGTDYKTRYSTPDGRVKVLPTAPFPNPVASNTLSNTNMTSTSGTLVRNNSHSPNSPNGLFKLPPPPSPSRPNKSALNKVVKPSDSKGQSVQQSRVPENHLNQFYSATHCPNLKYNTFDNFSSLQPQRAVVVPPLAMQPKILPNRSPIIPSRKMEPTTKENGAVFCDMKRLQNELAQIKLELAAMSEPMKEHDEWLQFQSEQVKELAQQQKSLQSSIQAQKTVKKNTPSSISTASLPPLPTSPRPNLEKNQSKETTSPLQKAVEKSDSHATATKVQVLQKTTPANTKEKSIHKENDKKVTSSHREKFNTVNVKRMSGIFEAVTKNDKQENQMNPLNKQNRDKIRKSVVVVGTSPEILQELQRQKEQNDASGNTNLSRSKSMLSLRPPPSPKPILSSNAKHKPSVSIKPTPEIQAEPHVSQQPSSANISLTPPNVQRVIAAPPPLPPKISNGFTNVAKSNYQTHDKPLENFGEVVEGSHAVSMRLQAPPVITKSETKFRDSESSLDTDLDKKVLIKECSPASLHATLPASKSLQISAETSPQISSLLPPSGVHSSTPLRTSHVTRPLAPPPLPPMSVPSTPPPPPPPPPPQSSRLPLSPSPLHNNSIPHESDGSNSPFRNENSSRPISVSAEPNSPTLQLLDEIRGFGKSGRGLRKTPSENNDDGGTPQSVKKDIMHNALLTRFQAFCGSASDSSDNDEDYEWDDE